MSSVEKSISERISEFRELARSSRDTAAIAVGGFVLSTYGTIISEIGEDLMSSGLGAGAAVLSAGVAVRSSLRSMAASQEVATMQGELVRHQLEQGVPK